MSAAALLEGVTVPIGIPVADIMAGAHLAQGILAALFRREKHGIGAHIETSLLEAMVDLQFEFLTTYLNNGREHPRRLASGSAHGYQPAPYGLYETADGHIALAMGNLEALADTLDIAAIKDLLGGGEDKVGFKCRDEIQSILANRLKRDTSSEIIDLLSQSGLWCARVLTWDELLNSEVFRTLEMVHALSEGESLIRSPLRIDGARAEVKGLAPVLPV